MHNLAESIGELLHQCIDEKGFELPIIVATVGVNGSFVVMRCDAGKEALVWHVLAEHSEGATFALPINMMFSDQRGEAARVIISSASAKPQLMN